MPVRLWDQNGQKVWQGNADAWGNCQPETFNNAIHQPLRLPGQFEDELTGIVQNRFRDYDPATGRYLTPDPYGIKGGLNSYRYTPNPVDYVDPLGLDFKPCVSASNVDKADTAPISENVPAAQETAAEEGFGAFVLGGAREFLHDTLVSAHSYMTGLTPEEIGDPMGLSPKDGAQAAGAQAYKDNALAINLATAFIPGRHQKVARDIADSIAEGVPHKIYSEGLAYRTDLREHLAGPHGFKKNGTLHGTHNLNNAIEALVQKGATYELTPTGVKGISELNYKYFNESKGKYVSGRKTVYDPSIYSDDEILNMSQSVGEQAFEMYKSGNIQNFYDISSGGVNFRAYINFDPDTGVPFVGNVHPIN